MAHGWPGANRGEIVQFIPRSERARIRLIREARAINGSIFPSSDPVGARRDTISLSHTAGGATTNRHDGTLLS
ncbi:hypothetical protein [Bradyrhizobium sp. AS23.2]|uniref:hypothetical protein n=1 Tax=Bradyrhizobium sp. AS23.2 TaxID=1680155 RepID=UPI00093C41E8|nr:hypothetical protein [Bradyrhizobium sp. AS23.2]